MADINNLITQIPIIKPLLLWSSQQTGFSEDAVLLGIQIALPALSTLLLFIFKEPVLQWLKEGSPLRVRWFYKTITGEYRKEIYNIKLRDNTPYTEHDTTYHYRSSMLRFYGRKAERAQLDEFLKHGSQDKNFSWWIVIGAGGTGKSRMAFELCRQYEQQGFRAGFFNPDSLNQLDGLKTWKPNKNTLLVIDYVSGHSDAIKTLILNMIQHCPSFDFSVRLLLLERDEKILEGLTTGRHAEQIKPYLFQNKPLALKALQDNEKLDIIREILTRKKKPVPSEENLLRHIQKIDPDNQRALFCAYIGETLADNHQTELSALELLASILKKEEERWADLVQHSDKQLRQYKNVIFFSTLNGGFEKKLYLEDTPFTNALKAVIGNNYDAGMYSRLTGKTVNTETVQPLEPDLLGEYFLLKHWQKAQEQPQLQTQLETLMTLSWMYPKTDIPYVTYRVLNDFKAMRPEQSEQFIKSCTRFARDNRHEASIREKLATALYNWTVSLDTPEKIEGIVSELRALHQDFGEEAPVREKLAKALFNWTVGNTPEGRATIVAELRALHQDFGEEAPVRKELAKALVNWTVSLGTPEEIEGIVSELRALHQQFPAQDIIKEALARTLANRTIDNTQEGIVVIVNELKALHDNNFGKKASVIREQLAKALFNWTVSLDTPEKIEGIVSELRALHQQFPAEDLIKEVLARAISNLNPGVIN